MTTTPLLWLALQQANTTDSGTTGDDQTGIKLIALANGNFVALWESNTDDGVANSGGTDIVGQIYDAEGNKIGSEFRANQGFFADDEGDFTAVGLPNGQFAIAYEDTDSNGTAIRYNILNADGTVAITGTIASDPGADDLGAPSITVNSDGSFLVAYQQRDTVNNQTDTFATIVNSAGTAGSPFLLLSGGLSADVGAGGQQVDVTTLTNGNYVIIARQLNGDNGFNMRIVSSTGANVLGFTEVSNTIGDGETDVSPAVAALSGGGFVVVWQNTDLNDTEILFQRYDASGVAQGGQFGVSDGGATDNDRTPDVVGLSDGGFVVVLDDNELGTIALQRFSSTGAAVGSKVVVATDTGSTTNSAPTISLSDDGRLLVGWTATTGTDSDVNFAIFDPRENIITGDATGEVITAFVTGGTVDGGAGNDTIFGSSAVDTLKGGDGDDTIHGRGGDDIIEGGFNADTIFGDDGNDTIFAMTQANPDDSGVADTISGGNGNDTITGSAAGDTIDGDADDDTIDGGGGADTLRGGTGNDTFIFNTGDVVSAEIINGGADSDRLLVQTETSFVDAALTSIEEIEFFASAPAQTITVLAAQIGAGLASNLILDFNATNTADKFLVQMQGATSVNLSQFVIQDFDAAGSENDRISVVGDADNETIRGTTVRDELDGGDGDDTLNGGLGADDLIGGSGSDRATYTNAAAGLIVSLTTPASNTGEAAGDTFSSIENLTGSAFVDTLTGDANANKISGGNGNDTLVGLNGNDKLSGGNDNDLLNGGLGADALDGGAGTDRVTYANAVAGLVVNLATAAQNTGEASGDTFTSIENLTGSAFNDTLTGNSGANSINGGKGNDTIQGLAGNDKLTGSDGNDTLNGGAGADELSGGAGSDRATYVNATAGLTVSLTKPSDNTGEAKNDTFSSIENLTGSAFNDTLTGNSGANSINGGKGNDTIKGLAGNDKLTGSDGNDTLNGGAGADELSGGAGSDRATYANATAGLTASLTKPSINTGEAKNDTYSSIENLTGSKFKDTLIGNSSANSINGGDGNDTINGRAGSDKLTGGAGKDNFLFDTAIGASNVDTITDFKVADDTIRLENSIFNAIVGTGTLSSGQFRSNNTGKAGDSNDRIIHEKDTGKIFYDTNGDAAGGSTLIAKVDAGLSLTNADFFIV